MSKGINGVLKVVAMLSEVLFIAAYGLGTEGTRSFDFVHDGQNNREGSEAEQTFPADHFQRRNVVTRHEFLLNDHLCSANHLE